MRKSSKILSLFFGLALIAFVAVPVLAEENNDVETNIDPVVISEDANDSATTTTTTRRTRPFVNIQKRLDAAKDRAAGLREKREARRSEFKEKREARLTEVRLRRCETRKSRINNRVNKMLTRGVAVNKGHAKIQERVGEFYSDRLLANGYELDNFDELAENMETSRDNVTSLLELARDSGDDFDCNSDDPIGQIKNIKEDMTELIEAKKEYRESVREFVTAVIALAKEAREGNQSGAEDTNTVAEVDEGGAN